MIVAKINKEIKYLIVDKCIRFLRSELEAIAFDYIKEFGATEFKFYCKTKSGFWKSHPFGYFMVKDKNKITVYNKFIDKGWIYNNYNVKKICSFYLLPPEKNKFINVLATNIELQTNKRQYFGKIHEEIKSRNDGEEKLEIN